MPEVIPDQVYDFSAAAADRESAIGALGAAAVNGLAFAYYAEARALARPMTALERILPLVTGWGLNGVFGAHSFRETERAREDWARVNEQLSDMSLQLSLASPGKRDRLGQSRQKLEDQRALIALDWAVAEANVDLSVLAAVSAGLGVFKVVNPLAVSLIAFGSDAVATGINYANVNMPESWRLWLGHQSVSEGHPSEATRLNSQAAQRVGQLRDNSDLPAAHKVSV